VQLIEGFTHNTEVFEDKQNIEKYTKAADVYSYAMVFYEVLTGNWPWCDAQCNPTVRMSDLLPSIRRGERPSLPPDCPAYLSAFISVGPQELKTILSFLKSGNSCDSARVRF